MSKSTPNTLSTNWSFKLHLHTSSPSEEQLSIPLKLIEDENIGYVRWQHEKWSNSGLSFLHGIIHCNSRRSLRQMERLLSGPIYKPRNVNSTTDNIEEYLKPFNRIGEGYSCGSPPVRAHRVNSSGIMICKRSCAACCAELHNIKINYDLVPKKRQKIE